LFWILKQLYEATAAVIRNLPIEGLDCGVAQRP
jgi:hypothetical protein